MDSGCRDAGTVIRVVAGALLDAHRQVLIAQRPTGRHMAGAWEFPGGKIAAGETEEQALERELREELGITVRAARHFMRLTHPYPDRTIELSLWVVEAFEGTPAGLDGQALKWVPVSMLDRQDILAADAPFIAGLQAGFGGPPAGAT